MLWLKSQGFETLFQSAFLKATLGGGEANVAVSQANFGVDVSFVTALPKNLVGDACVEYLRGKGVLFSQIEFSGRGYCTLRSQLLTYSGPLYILFLTHSTKEIRHVHFSF